MTHVRLEDAISPLVLAIDVGSSSVRALLFDAESRQIDATEHQITYSLETTPDGGSFTDAETLVHLVVQCIDTSLARSRDREHDIAAVGITTFWHALLGLNQEHCPSTPIFMWADTRSGSDARRLEAEHAAIDAHRITGCRFHSSYWPAKLNWLNRVDPEAFSRTAYWTSFADYLAWRFHGALRTSTSLASGTGLLDSIEMVWSSDVVALTPATSEQLPEIVDRDEPMPPLRAEWQSRWPALAEARWLPAIGDGATANIGSYCVGRDRVALTVGTSGAMRVVIPAVPDSTLSPAVWRYRLDRNNFVIGGALSNGGNIMAWLADLVGDRDFDALASEARTVPPDGHGLTVLPLLAGERSPSWDDRGGGAITGLRLDTSPGDLFRAFLEATAYRFAAIYEGLQPLIDAEHDIYANGGAALRSPLWLQIVADTLDHSLYALQPEAEASARGAAVCALHAIGEVDSIRLDPGSGLQTYNPQSSRHEIYAAGRGRLERLESTLRSLADAEGANEHQE